MPQRLHGDLVLLDPVDCLHLAGLLAAGVTERARRDGGVPPRLAAIAEHVAAVARTHRDTVGSSDIGTSRFRQSPVVALSAVSANWLTVGQSAQRMQTSLEYVRRLCRQGTLTGVRSASRGTWLVDEASVAEWLGEHRQEAS